MLQNADEGLMAKEALTGKIMENETTEVIKETSASTLGLVVLALNMVDTVYSPQVVQSNEAGLRRKVCQAWGEKLAINMIIWFFCGFHYSIHSVHWSLHTVILPAR
ncbi:hypothetical protein J3R83DRAFT_8783 [Lanmaoa asiatica]|nr:hypothetical protein J3R83DRAFT_8783 [Lanmaoa asiatica]